MLATLQVQSPEFKHQSYCKKKKKEKRGLMEWLKW
jgi:hypothetical protein